MSQFDAGQYAGAVERAKLMVERFPDFGFAWKVLGAALQQMGRGDDAVAAMQQAAVLLLDDAETQSNLGFILKTQGRSAEAEASYRRAVQINPDYAEAHYNRGINLVKMERLNEAAASFRRVAEIAPGFAEAHSNLGMVMQDLGQSLEAEASYCRAVEIKPNFAEAHSNRGIALRELGRFDDAVASFNRALEIQPNFISARLNLVQTMKVKVDDENFAALVAIEDAGGKSLPAKEREPLHYALGKCYSDIGDHEKAFPYFLEGAKLHREASGYNPDRMAQMFAEIKRHFDAKTIASLSGGGDPAQLPVFVLGMPRSGTTLTEQIISSHPDVHGAGELPDLMMIARRNIEGVGFPDYLRLLDQKKLATWGSDYVAGLQRRAPGMRRITDKMPENFLAVGLIHLLLPNAKIVHVNRNPVDNCVSCFTQAFRAGSEYTYDLAELGRFYVDYHRLMQHWREVLPKGAFLDVQYEDIVANQEGESRRILEYCGLEWDEACLDFHKHKRAVSTASVMQVRQPIYKSSVERWRCYETFLQPLFDALGDLAPDR